MLVTTHYMDEAERCHRLAFIFRGELLDVGTPEEIVERARPARGRGRGRRARDEAAELLRALPGGRRGQLTTATCCASRCAARRSRSAWCASALERAGIALTRVRARRAPPSRTRSCRWCARTSEQRSDRSGGMTRLLAVIAWKELLQLRRDRLTLGMMVGAAGDAAAAVRLRDQHRRAPHADGGLRPGPQRRVARPGRSAWGDRLLRRASAACATTTRSRARCARAARASRWSCRRASASACAPGSPPGAAGGRRLRSADRRQRDQHRGVAGRGALARAAAPSASRARRSACRSQPISLEPTTWYNPELRTAVYVVPGLVGVILTMTMVDAHRDGDRARARARHARAADRLAGAAASS